MFIYDIWCLPSVSVFRPVPSGKRVVPQICLVAIFGSNGLASCQKPVAALPQLSINMWCTVHRMQGIVCMSLQNDVSHVIHVTCSYFRVIKHTQDTTNIFFHKHCHLGHVYKLSSGYTAYN